MTDYELMSLSYQLVDTAGSSWANDLTGVFAMLAAGSFVAHRLGRPAPALVSVMFTLFCSAMTNEMRGLDSDLARVAREIERQAGPPGSTPVGHPAAGVAPFHLIPMAVVGISALTCIGAMWLFFRAGASGGPGLTAER